MYLYIISVLGTSETVFRGSKGRKNKPEYEANQAKQVGKAFTPARDGLWLNTTSGFLCKGDTEPFLWNISQGPKSGRSHS